MRPRQLRQFLAVCRHQSMSAAAQELNIAQPALSKQIAQLEHELQAPLFERHSRGVRLTQQGETLRNKAAELIRQIEAIKTTIKHQSQSVEGKVTLSVIASLAPTLAVGLYKRLEREFPKLEVALRAHSSELAGRVLERQEADLAVLPNVASDLPQSASTPLFSESFHLIRQAQPAGLTSPVKLADALKLPMVMPPPGHDLRRRIEEAARSAGMQLHIKYETESIDVVSKIVEEGLACSIAPATYWLDSVIGSRISTQAITQPEISRVHSLCWIPEQTKSPAVAVVKDVIETEIQALIAGGKISGVWVH